MAFRFRLDEPIQKGFRRIGLEQIERARRQLSARLEPATEIHETRKCLKRIRALLRLGRVGLGEEVFKEENARFRDIAAALAPARDVHVLLETIVRLESEATATMRPALAELKTAISTGHAPRPVDAATTLATALTDLERAQRRMKRLRIAPDTFEALALGLTHSYRRAVKAFDAAYATGDDEAFHEWRKGVQAQWRHMQLLSRLWPEVIDARIAAARELSQFLGDDHDLSVLRVALTGEGGARLKSDQVRAISQMIASRQHALRAAAKPRGLKLFAESAKAHGKHMTALWGAAVAMSREDAKEKDAEPAQMLRPRQPAIARI
jgi:CHAD domain-containing protein